MSTVKFENNMNDEKCPVYHQYPGQCNPQKAYIEINEEGKITADWDAEIGNAVSAYVWHGRTLQILIPAAALQREIEQFIESHMADFQIINDGHSVEWDGSNHVGNLTDEARDMLDDLSTAAMEEIGCANVYDSYDYVTDSGWADAWPKNCTLAQAVEEFEDNIDTDDYVPDGFEDALLSYAEHQLDNGRKLHDNAKQALIAKRKYSAEDFEA